MATRETAKQQMIDTAAQMAELARDRIAFGDTDHWQASAALAQAAAALFTAASLPTPTGKRATKAKR